ncbi:MAG: hypothetical protein ABW168_22100 [Sedimenticola sp.]
MRNKLDAGYERVIWADADLLVFAPSRLNVQVQRGHAFAHELFLCMMPDGGVMPIEGMNNALMVFEREQDILDIYLNSALERLQTLPQGPVPRTALGPALLIKLACEFKLDMLHGVGLFTPALMHETTSGGGPLTLMCVRRSSAPLGAANLCHFLRNVTPVQEREKFDVLYDTAVHCLLDSGGNVLERAAQYQKSKRNRRGKEGWQASHYSSVPSGFASSGGVEEN